MKIIFDIGCNIGQNFNYFFNKADIVVGIDANKELCDKLIADYEPLIKNRKLFIENVALTNDEKIKETDFFILKTNNLESTLHPKKNIKQYEKVTVKSKKLSSLIKKYLEMFKISEVEYIKIDIEGCDFFVLKDLFENKIFPINLSAECHSEEVIKQILFSPYKSFKFLKGGDLKKLNDVEILDKNSIKKIIDFKTYSSGPYGSDIPGGFYDKNSILPFFLNNGLGWIDIHCNLNEQIYIPAIKYNFNTHRQGLRYHLRNLYPSLIKMLKKKFLNLFKK